VGPALIIALVVTVLACWLLPVPRDVGPEVSDESMILVLLEDDDGSEVLMNGTQPVFDTADEAGDAARKMLEGIARGRMWASVFELKHLETFRAKED
jgi:hypothetical protein